MSASASFENGKADGTAIATSDTGTPNPWDTVIVDANATLTYSTAQFAHGTRSAHLTTNATGSSPLFGWSTTQLGAAVTETYGRFYFRLHTVGNINANIWRPLSAVVTACAAIQISTGRRFVLRDSTANLFTSSATTGVLALDTWCRVEMHVLQAAGGAGGSAQMKVWFTMDSAGTPDIDSGVVAGNFLDATTAPMALRRFGPQGGTVVQNIDCYFDDIVQGAATWPGPYVAATTASEYYEYKQLSSSTTLSIALTGAGADSNEWLASIVAYKQTAVPPDCTSTPAVTGTPVRDQVLTCGTGTWTGSPTFAYQWQRSSDLGSTWSDISGSTANTRTLVTADVGKVLRCIVTATNETGSQPVGSTITAAITVPAAPVNTVLPAVTGASPLTQGDTLTCSNGTWTGAPTFTRQWFRVPNVIPFGVGTAISGATATTYVTQAADADQLIYCEVTATNASGSTVVDSNTVGPSYSTPVNTTPPVVTGVAAVGGELDTDDGSWIQSPTSITYQWQQSANGTTGWTNISGANTDIFVPAVAGGYLRCNVTATNPDGSATQASNVVGPVTGGVSEARRGRLRIGIGRGLGM